MNQKYWNRISRNYQTEVLSVFDNDAEGIVEQKVLAAGVTNPSGRAADLGCGVGRFTPLLAEVFPEVEACDFSEVALRKAKRRCRSVDNVSFYTVDLTRDAIPFEPVDFAFCVNVLIMPSMDQRLRAWRAVANQVKTDGMLLLVVPSLESAQMEFYSAIELHLDDGCGCGEAVQSSIEEKATAKDLRLGVYQLDGVRTKHYLKDELEGMLDSHGFEVGEVSKLVYPADDDGEFESWDWIVDARKR